MTEQNGNIKLDDEPALIRLPRRTAATTELEQPELRRGSRPGERMVRLARPGQRRFAVAGDQTLQATPRAIAPRSGVERVWRGVRRLAIGAPLTTMEQEHERLSKLKALAVFSSDALSSSAYATDEILIVLSLAGAGALGQSVKLALVIGGLLAIVAFSYRQTIKSYPSGGGAYIVARDNLGDAAGLIAAAALAVDYVLTVAVSVAAGVLAITSAFPSLAVYNVPIALGCILLITLANLRGIRESGTIFAMPTYGFLLSFGAMLVWGFVRVATHPDLRAPEPDGLYVFGAAPLTLFLFLRAFASGCTALTGVEAISNGIPAFKRPESHNASITLSWMAAILAALFIGITILAHLLHVQPSETVSVPAQVGKVVFGQGLAFYTVQAFTALILILAANTSYADFPRLASILARDRFLPHQFTFRGDRLAFSNGILFLGVTASVLIVIFHADVTSLIPLYAFGVFVSFTLSQSGMVARWRRLRETGWRFSLAVNAVGATATGVVAVIIGGTKFASGAWVSMLAMALLALTFWTIHRHFQGVEAKVAVPDDFIVTGGTARQAPVIVPVDELNRVVLETIEYARSLSDYVVALHVTDDMVAGGRLLADWDAHVMDVPLVLIESPYRSFVSPVLSYIDALQEKNPESIVTVVLPEYRANHVWQRWLHNQSSRRLLSALRSRPRIVTAESLHDL